MSAQEAYVLSFRRDDIKEDERLDWQHELIKHLIWGGQLIQASIPLNNLINNHSSNSRIADVGCGTGIWLKEVADIILPSAGNQEAAPPRLVGFDTNPRAFRYESTTPSLQLIEHDCTTPFAAEYIGQFDLVNIRGLAYAIPEGKFPLLIKNVIQLLKPGGYLQWTESEARLFKDYPETAEISQARKIIEHEREGRGLVAYLPHFMLRQILSHDFKDSKDVNDYPSGDSMTMLNFNLIPAGFANVSSGADEAMKLKFSDILLESVDLLLNAALLRRGPEKQQEESENEEAGNTRADKGEKEEILKLVSYIKEVRESGAVRMGGIFPVLVAQKSMNI